MLNSFRIITRRLEDFEVLALRMFDLLLNRSALVWIIPSNDNEHRRMFGLVVKSTPCHGVFIDIPKLRMFVKLMCETGFKRFVFRPFSFYFCFKSNNCWRNSCKWSK
ncbi:hypothetical protein DRO42_07925 [Candidatus Bathyarchaeota archaeon]|nr:MAG: hypothetical protein DRO42_07925 [Candidatus Bathyarchaeota archaeon]